MRIVRFAVRTVAFVKLLGNASHLIKNVRHAFPAGRGPVKQHQEEITMKKSTLVAIIACLSAIAGALGAMFLYLRRREAELDEYEQLLFSEDFSEETPEPEADEHLDEDAEAED